MNEKQTLETMTVRPTKKQRELLTFIEQFIQEHGYSPSYREIMAGLNYTSVATVALHVKSLIKRGHLRKRDHSARSLEVVAPSEPTKVTTNQSTASEEKWLIERVEHAFTQCELEGATFTEKDLADLATLLSALQILSMEGAAQSFSARLSDLRKRAASLPE